MPLTIRENPEAKPQSMVTLGSRAAGVILDGGEGGGNSALSPIIPVGLLSSFGG